MKHGALSWRGLTTIRGRLVLWYLGVLAALLLGIGVLQSVTLTDYLRSTTFESLQSTAHGVLKVAGPCFIRSSAQLSRNAQSLALLLGSRDTAVKIVTPSGVTLADHGFGQPGSYQAMRLSAAAIRAAILSDNTAASPATQGTRPYKCLQPPVPVSSGSRTSATRSSSGRTSANNLFLYTVSLGPPGHVVGYAILGRSMVSAYDTVRRTQLVFELGALLALLVTAVVAMPIINRALRPLDQVTCTAEAIADGDLQKRANLSHSADEVGRLGSAFDSMVDRLQAALSAATQSEERMRRFLADASHELRTPLTVLRGTSQILLRQEVDRDEYDSSLSAIHFEAVRLSRLVDDLLTLTRLDAGQAFEPQNIAIRDFVEEFIDRYGVAWPKRAIRVDSAQWDGAEARVDPEALRRILTNLIDNAAQYSTPGKPITLSGRVTDGTVSITVHDEGPGLAPEDAELVFQRFYRANLSRSRQSGGTGLGLSIVSALAQANGGEIHMDTAPERGTTVEFTLPRLR